MNLKTDTTLTSTVNKLLNPHKEMPVYDSKNKIIRLSKLINWDYLEKELGYQFKGEKSPPTRLIIGLLYLQSLENLPFSEVISIWKKSPEWQYFCGYSEKQFSLHETSLSIWSRVIGTSGRIAMTHALSAPKETKPTRANTSYASEDKELQEVIQMDEKDMDIYLKEEGLNPDDLVTKAKQHWNNSSRQKNNTHSKEKFQPYFIERIEIL